MNIIYQDKMYFTYLNVYLTVIGDQKHIIYQSKLISLDKSQVILNNYLNNRGSPMYSFFYS